MEIKAETVKKLAYPALAAVMATAALGACPPPPQQPQRLGGEPAVSKHTKSEAQKPTDSSSGSKTTTETKVEPPQRLGGVPLAPKKSSSTKH